MPTSYSEGEVTVEGGECSCEAGKGLAKLEVSFCQLGTTHRLQALLLQAGWVGGCGWVGVGRIGCGWVGVGVGG